MLPTADTVTPAEIVRAIIDGIGVTINGTVLILAIADLVWVLSTGSNVGRRTVALMHLGPSIALFGMQLVLLYEAYLQLITPSPINPPVSTLARQSDSLVDWAVVLVAGAGLWSAYFRWLVGRYVSPQPLPDEATRRLVEQAEHAHHPGEPVASEEDTK